VINRPFRLDDGTTFKRVNLVNASAHQFCETLRLAASIGASDVMINHEPRTTKMLVSLLCTEHRVGHARVLKQAYSAGRFHVEMMEQQTVPTRARAQLNRTIEDVALSTRTFNTMCSGKIYFLGDLVSKTDTQLYTIRNFGRRSLQEIKTLLASLGLRLGMTVGSWHRPRSAPWDSPETWSSWQEKQHQQYRMARTKP